LRACCPPPARLPRQPRGLAGPANALPLAGGSPHSALASLRCTVQLATRARASLPRLSCSIRLSARSYDGGLGNSGLQVEAANVTAAGFQLRITATCAAQVCAAWQLKWQSAWARFPPGRMATVQRTLCQARPFGHAVQAPRSTEPDAPTCARRSSACEFRTWRWTPLRRSASVRVRAAGGEGRVRGSAAPAPIHLASAPLEALIVGPEGSGSLSIP
jgi:hypothetical protein